MALSHRLQSILSMMTPGYRLLDIGSDHALLCIEAIKQNKVKEAISADNKEGPLKRAKLNIKEYELEDKITPILSDGALSIDIKCDRWVMAGMGAETIINILESSKEKAQEVDEILLCAHSKNEELKKYLFENGYKIQKHQLIYDKSYYHIMSITYDGKSRKYTLCDLHLGDIKRDEVYKSWLEHQKNHYYKLKQVNNDFNDLYQCFNQEFSSNQFQEMD